MSLNPIPLRIVQSMDEVMAFKQEREFAVYDGGQEISYQNFVAQNPNVSNITITCNPPSPDTVLDPRITLTAQYRIDFVGVGPGATDPLLVLGQYDGPRSFPIAQTMNTCELKINGTSFNTNLNEYWSVINRTGMYSRDLNQEYSATFSALDQSQNYSQLIGSIRNPLNNYADSAPFFQGRCAGLSTIDPDAQLYVQTNNHTNATVFLNVTEPLFLSPFYPSKVGMPGISTGVFNANFGLLSRLWSHEDSANSGVFSSINVTIEYFAVNMRFITPKDLSIIPKQWCLPYHEFLLANTNMTAATNPLSSNSVSLNAINLGAHPQRLVFVVRQQDQDYLNGPNSYQQTDTYARIDKITINYANNQGKLSSATVPDLYQMYVNNSNGSMSYVEWTQTVGSVLVCDIGRDIGLPNLDAPSKLATPLLYVTVDFTNINPTKSIIFTLWCFIIYEGTMVNNYGSISKNISVLNSQDVLKSQEPGVPTLIHHEPSNVYGGNFFSSVKNLLKKGHDFAKKNRLVSKGLSMINNPYAQAASQVADKLGYGRRKRAGAVITMPQYYNDIEELRPRAGKKRKMSRKGLKRRGGSLEQQSDNDSQNGLSDSDLYD